MYGVIAVKERCMNLWLDLLLVIACVGLYFFLSLPLPFYEKIMGIGLCVWTLVGVVTYWFWGIPGIYMLIPLYILVLIFSPLYFFIKWGTVLRSELLFAIIGNSGVLLDLINTYQIEKIRLRHTEDQRAKRGQ